jgi:outer membrane protein assembly factor BamB
VPRPVFAHGLIYVCSGFDRATLYAIRPDGQGDVTDTHLAWKHERAIPKESSPLVVGDLLFLNDDRGIASCFDARNGKVHWQERIAPGAYSSSPVYADGKVYFQSGEGGGTVVAPAITFTKLGENNIGDRIQASYAIADNAIFLRTENGLFRIEE